MRLSEHAVGRNNNFNLIRLLAALGVIFTHSVAVLGLPPDREVFFGRLGFSLGDMAVDVFFVTSGFLVTSSLVNRQSLVAFLWARALRIYPALWVMLALTVFLLAPAVTNWPLAQFFGAHQTSEYVLKCGTLITGIRYSLPGIFESSPLRGVFNASLWTLPIEVRLYLGLGAAWFVLALAPAVRIRVITLAAPLATTLLLILIARRRLVAGDMNPGDVSVFMFLYGSSLFLWRDQISLSRSALVALPAALLVASLDPTLYFCVYVLGLAPLVVHLAFIPSGRVRSFNKLGDYSYGTYIYAFPIQQTLGVLFPGLSLGAMAAASTLATLVAAAFSWRLIEKRALTHKEDLAEATQRTLRLALSTLAAAVRRQGAP